MKRSKLVLFYGDKDLLGALEMESKRGSLWGIPGEDTVYLTDFATITKEERSFTFECVRRSYPNARFVLVNMEKTDAGKLTYEVVEL